MNELDLIKEVEKRPILYDKSVSGFNKTKLRDEAWKEVQDALNTTAITAPGSDSDAEDDKLRSIQCLPDLSFMGETTYEDPASPQPSLMRARTSSSDDEYNSCLCNRSSKHCLNPSSELKRRRPATS
ncbi:Transcription factor Adf-1-like protein, partial [Operophtera brumata]